jgi:predicted nuclease of predicted toxin-antitoxin system
MLDFARREARVLVTLDKDIGYLALAFGRPHAGIVRLVGVSAIKQGEMCAAVLEKYASELSNSAIFTVEPGRIRIREGSA